MKGYACDFNAYPGTDYNINSECEEHDGQLGYSYTCYGAVEKKWCALQVALFL